MEKGTMDFYSHAAAKALNHDARKMFGELSQWEHKHMDFIGYLYQSIHEDKDVIGFEKFTKRRMLPVTEAGIPVKDLEAKLEKHEFVDDMGALILALEIEGRLTAFTASLQRAQLIQMQRLYFRKCQNRKPSILNI